MITKITLDALTDRGVSIKSQKYVIDEGKEYSVDLPHRCSYQNSDRGRVSVAANLEEPYLSAVMSVWGDEPTVFLIDDLPQESEE